MRFDLRIAVPAALAVAAAAFPAVSAADSPNVGGCPDPQSDYVLVPVLIAPAGASKDNNGDGFVCEKTTTGSVKDDNQPPSLDPNDYVDNL